MQKKGRPHGGRPSALKTVAAAGEDAQDVEEQVDEVQIQFQRREHRGLLCQFRVAGVGKVSGLDLLGVVGGVAGKDDDAHAAQQDVHPAEEHAEHADDEHGDEAEHQGLGPSRTGPAW